MSESTRQTGLDCKVPANLAWRVLSEGANDFVSVPDDCIDPCIELLKSEAPDLLEWVWGSGIDYENHFDYDDAIFDYEQLKEGWTIDAGESAVAGLGALVASAAQPELAKALGLDRTSRVGLVVCEGNPHRSRTTRLMNGIAPS